MCALQKNEKAFLFFALYAFDFQSAICDLDLTAFDKPIIISFVELQHIGE